MSDHTKRANPVLVFITITLCLICGASLTRSSANPSPLSEETTPDMVLVKEAASEKPKSSEDNASENITITETPTPIPEITPTPVITEKPNENEYVPSEEATLGTWTSSGSNWLFLIDGIPHYGWLYDVDGKIYYFNVSGIMVTGWQDIGSKRYYFNLDGIMQTGDIVYKGETYHLLADGSLEGYTKKKKKSN